MSQVFEVLQDRYRELVRRLGEPADEALVESLQAFLVDARQGSASVADPLERSQLRAYMRFVAVALQERGEETPRIDLLPLDRTRWPVPVASKREGLPPWAWMLLGAAALVVVAGLVAAAALGLAALAPRAEPTPLPSPTPLPPTPIPTATATTPPSPTPTLTPTFTPTPLPPAVFRNPVIALGMLDPSTPFLPGDVFDWNTKSVYLVFDYEGMQEGMPWAVVWRRGGTEIARQEYRWSLADGSSGKRWVVYFEPEGTVLRGGDYTVSLYIEDQLQAEAAFRIRFYVTPTPAP